MNTTERLTEIIGGCTFNAEAAHWIAAEFVLIPRTEIPKVIEHEDGALQADGDLGIMHLPSAATWPVSQRRQIAYAHLALAEAIDARNAEQEAAKAAELAADNAKLDAEALALYNAAWESEAAEMPGVASEKFRRLALAARRIHGVTK